MKTFNSKLVNFYTLVAAGVFSCSCSFAAVDNDVVLSALTDEMDRSMKELKLEKHPAPYFISYTVKEIDEASFASCLGAPSVFDHTRERVFTPIVKVGGYDLDSSYPTTDRPNTSYLLPLDDNYSAVRRAIWLNTDSEYKYAVRILEWKKAYLSSNNVVERLPDLTEEKPVVALDSVHNVNVDEKKWSKQIEELSAIFRNYPTLQKSKVSFIARTVNRWFVNSEGTKVRDSHNQYGVRIWATAQAGDGMPFEDCELVANPDESKLPDFAQLRQKTEALAQRLTDLRVAAKGEDYCGPVLFEDQAAAELFDQVMAPNFGFAEEYMGSEDFSNPLKNRLGRKIMSKQLSVVDNPYAVDANGDALTGTYKIDDEGVLAQPVELVQNGLLKAFCQSRIPTRHFNHSNGHSLGGHGVYSILSLSSSQPESPEHILAKASELGKDAGLGYVLLISRIKQNYLMREYPSADYLDERPYVTPSHSIQPSNPLIVYKLFLNDGHRELVRGLEFAYVSLRTFRDVQAVGNDPKPYIMEPMDYWTRSLITPSYLIGELELTPIAPEHSTPPILPSPLQAMFGEKQPQK
ncbi:MAG: metallopeptidase TldD-related protein [Candidatus Obscuribacterales bacterium]